MNTEGVSAVIHRCAREHRERRRIPIMVQLFSTFSLLLVLTILLLYTTFSDLSQRRVLDLARHNIVTIMEMAEGQLNEKAVTLIEQTLDVMVDADLYTAMSQMKENGSQAYDRLQNTIKTKYLPIWLYRIPDAVSIQILYENYTFTFGMAGSANYAAIRRSEIWERIQQAQGSVVWCPPDYDGQYFSGSEESSGYLWAARVLNMTDTKYIRQVFTSHEPKPVLIVCLSPNFFSELLLSSVGVEGARYALLDEAGQPLSSELALEGDGWQALAQRLSSAVKTQNADVYDDGNTLYFYVRSQATGWYHVIYMPRQLIAGDVLDEISGYFLRTSALLLLAMLAMSMLFSQLLSRPVGKLVAAVRQMERGEFGHEVQYRSVNEMGYLVEQFNRMSLSIQRLIQENYQVRLREKDTEILSLTTQFNPHYIYNTLNAIHWVAMRGDAREAAHMIRSLSSMMRYTSDQKQDRTRLQDDIEWMTHYLYLMEARYGDLFRTEWAIAPGLNDMLVPKLFLQPLVENCVLHGFKDMETGGLIVIEGRDAGMALEFVVRDNGCGMTQSQLDALFGDGASVGINNVRRRIQLLYGEAGALRINSNPDAGTCVTVTIPKESAIK